MSSTFHSLTARDTQLTIKAENGKTPRIVHWGRAVGAEHAAMLDTMTARQWVHGGPSVLPRMTLSNEIGVGSMLPPGLEAHRDGLDWAPVLRVIGVSEETDELIIRTEDKTAGLGATYRLNLNQASGVLEADMALKNVGTKALSVHWCSALCLPLDPAFTRLRGFTGRWANEFQTEEIALFSGSYVRENRRGRTSHDCFPGLLMMVDGAGETQGEAAGFHLGWSGHHRVRVDRGMDGGAVLQMGELLLPGEVMLAPGETYQTPTLFAARASDGLNGVSMQFHDHLLDHVMDERLSAKPRPVHFNTWEAVYFDHSEDRLMRLADTAADVGIERFVLDDGWFGGRRNDRSGLGDWQVSRDLYPNGLAPLASHVRARGMEFGLWFEPEMINEDSELFRKHPDWVLNLPGVPDIPSRHQRPLDLTRIEVCDYLFTSMSRIIGETGATYVKWDMNRDIHHPGQAGHAVMHAQGSAVYALMRRLRDTFPGLEIESCASGGGRADFGVLGQADRIWTSDSNDARDRQLIQRGASYFFPLAVSGAHVGPATCHITGRRHSLAFRIATAMVGHMGVELDLLDLTDEDVEQLRAGLVLYKRHRALLHAGVLHRLDAGADTNAVLCVARGGREAVLSWAVLGTPSRTHQRRLRLTGLDRSAQYSIRQIWPRENASVTSPSLVETGELMGNGLCAPGALLEDVGLQMPVIHPDTALIFLLNKTG